MVKASGMWHTCNPSSIMLRPQPKIGSHKLALHLADARPPNHNRSAIRCQANKNQPPENQPDIIERFVGWAFGQKALEAKEPMGMKRLNFDELPDQVVTSVTERAAPVVGDSPEVTKFRPLLSRTRLEAAPLRLAYVAEKDGWTFRDFHARVDGFGAGVVLIGTKGGAVFGGYNPEGWISLGEDRASNGAFLFTWLDGDTSKPPHKLAKIGGPNLAVIDRPDSGPQFGAEGLSVPLKPIRGQEQLVKSRLGTYYARLPDNTRSLFSANEDPKRTTMRWLRVYVADGKGEEWRLEGITWRTKTT